ncbi:MAG TPA: saccharopine dehydrogenase NADP-binding domain-containing protein, partial [Bdellovibrionota bacterium]|nr:saccharopine dehydrogenase NADP-binding domain-containing protein [Bdellovibrionota bacterium]
MKEYSKKILILGYGSVAQCTLPILTKHLKVPLSNITVMDFEDKAKDLKPWTDRGIKFVRDRVTPENMGALVGKFVSAGDMIIDLAWNI